MHLETERLILRPYAESDLPAYHELLSDKDNLYYLDDCIMETMEESRASLLETIEKWQNHTARRFAVTRKEDGCFMGGVGYEIAAETPIGRIGGPMGWFIMKAYQNKGYITEAVKRVLEYAFKQDNCVRMVTGCYKENQPTQRVMAKTGFRQEAEKIKAQWHDGKMKDRLEFAINRDEYIIK
jgi:ribosomal-protein-alanine N-acetyltransferase